MAIEAPHFSYPYAIGRAGSAVCEQDSPADLVARASNVAVCTIGFREDDPDFGIPELLFKSVPLDGSGVQEAIAQWAELDVSASEHAEALQTATRIIAVTVGG